MILLYFTATGNSLYIAKRLGGEHYSIPKLMKQERYNFEDDKIGIIFPTYEIGVPKIVEEFLEKSSLKSDYIFGIATYGAFSGAVASHLFQIGKRRGIHFSYINHILMIDNYLPKFDMEKQIHGEVKKNIEDNLNLIVQDITEKKEYIKKDSGLIKVIRLALKNSSNGSFDQKFIISSMCNSCKVCEKVCPVDNIKVQKNPIYMGNCQKCMACIQNCPQNAISLKHEKGRMRYRNKNILLKEIIIANE